MVQRVIWARPTPGRVTVAPFNIDSRRWRNSDACSTRRRQAASVLRTEIGSDHSSVDTARGTVQQDKHVTPGQATAEQQQLAVRRRPTARWRKWCNHTKELRRRQLRRTNITDNRIRIRPMPIEISDEPITAVLTGKHRTVVRFQLFMPGQVNDCLLENYCIIICWWLANPHAGGGNVNP